jgi:hypothetical protein
MFAMSRHLGKHPSMIGNLVGFAIAQMAIGSLEEMLEQPGCPNLYWALTNLPSPLVPIDQGIEGERALVLAEFRDLDERAPMSAEQLGRFIAYSDRLLSEPGKPVNVRAWFDARTKDASLVEAARRRLLEHGLAQEPLRRFPPDQVILLDEKREYEMRRDDVMKIMNLPSWQADRLVSEPKPATTPTLFADVLLGGVYNVRRQQVRLVQRIVLLRIVEALRLDAAEHDGSLPAKLSDVSVPLLDDPVSGKPFHYEVSGATAHIRGSAPAGRANDAAFKVHYEVALRK